MGRRDMGGKENVEEAGEDGCEVTGRRKGEEKESEKETEKGGGVLWG